MAMLKYLMQESGMTQAELGRLLENRSWPAILNGHRQLSKTHIANWRPFQGLAGSVS